jgi:hypothetical protein
VKKQILSVLLILFSLGLFASPQMPDYVIFGNDTIATYNLLLEQYLQKQDSTEIDRLFGLAFRDGASFNCWRGYQAIYKVDNDSLFLVDIINCGELRKEQIDKAKSLDKIKAIFGQQTKNDRVFINWFSGLISFPLTNKSLRWDGVFYRIYESEKVISITNGQVNNIKDVENYIDEPKRIDRRDKSKVSDILFKQLKKTKWKNDYDFDCSDKYLVTIDENGNVSKVRMVYSSEEIEEYYEKDEYDFCINKMFNTLKPLQFDILKDKGIPIPEDIYIEIWIENNGRIKNWTD